MLESDLGAALAGELRKIPSEREGQKRFAVFKLSNNEKQRGLPDYLVMGQNLVFCFELKVADLVEQAEKKVTASQGSILKRLEFVRGCGRILVYGDRIGQNLYQGGFYQVIRGVPTIAQNFTQAGSKEDFCTCLAKQMVALDEIERA